MWQRELHVQEEEEARKAIEAQGCEIVELTAAEHDAFAAAVAPLIEDARGTFGPALFDLTGSRAVERRAPAMTSAAAIRAARRAPPG